MRERNVGPVMAFVGLPALTIGAPQHWSARRVIQLAKTPAGSYLVPSGPYLIYQAGALDMSLAVMELRTYSSAPKVR